MRTTQRRARVVVAVSEYRVDNWPHLVVGDPDSEVAVQSMSACVRDGDRNRAPTAAEIHALMRARPPQACSSLRRGCRQEGSSRSSTDCEAFEPVGWTSQPA